ncbi:MAG TPA: hypothetical protein VFT87_00210 [Candidatus Saccharimonadales bacterium]|nr:hypothetical protein [Candidatus Saccharimonadales bacterium]
MNAESRPSKRQRELLGFIESFIANHGYGPSYREVMHALNYKSVSTVATHIENLITKGHLRKRDRSARSLEIVQGQAAVPTAANTIPAEEKWLIDQITKKFTQAETAKAASDDLYVLVGALQVLGLEEAARSFKARLFSLASSKGGDN